MVIAKEEKVFASLPFSTLRGSTWWWLACIRGWKCFHITRKSQDCDFFIRNIFPKIEDFETCKFPRQVTMIVDWILMKCVSPSRKVAKTVSTTTKIYILRSNFRDSIISYCHMLLSQISFWSQVSLLILKLRHIKLRMVRSEEKSDTWRLMNKSWSIDQCCCCCCCPTTFRFHFYYSSLRCSSIFFRFPVIEISVSFRCVLERCEKNI